MLINHRKPAPVSMVALLATEYAVMQLIRLWQPHIIHIYDCTPHASGEFIMSIKSSPTSVLRPPAAIL